MKVNGSRKIINLVGVYYRFLIKDLLWFVIKGGKIGVYILISSVGINMVVVVIVKVVIFLKIRYDRLIVLVCKERIYVIYEYD